MLMQNRKIWYQIFREAIAVGALANSKRTNKMIDSCNTFTTFGVRILAYTGGNVTVKLRFGFQSVDADTSPNGINFRNLAALDDSDYASQVWAAGAAAPGVSGNANSILPPVMKIMIDTAAGTTLTYEVLGAYLFYP